MNFAFRFVMAFAMSVCMLIASGQKIQRFEYFSSKEGLSQNTIYSMLCDSKGFLWLGTMNGLNRFDGSSFKIYKWHGGSETAPSNRVSRIWEDKAGFIWNETYDGCYQYFNPRLETFGIIPEITTNLQQSATAFLQYSDKIVFVGTKSAKLYMLVLTDGQYVVNTINLSDNNNVEIRNLCTDSQKRLWVLTNAGLFSIEAQDIDNNNMHPKHYFDDVQFTYSVCATDANVLFGTYQNGLLIYNTDSDKFDYYNDKSIIGNHITLLKRIGDGSVIVGTDKGYAYVITPDLKKVTPLHYHGEGYDVVEHVFVDKYRQAWITTHRLGVTRVNLTTFQNSYYELTPKNLSASVDHERPFFYEDTYGTLWIGLHGGGLASYDRLADKFKLYRNDVNDWSSIPSNIVHCIVEDKSGQLWIGTGQYRGGLSKVVMGNEAFQTITPQAVSESQMDNVVRCLFEDPAHNLWVSTKSGYFYIYNANNELIKTFQLSTTDKESVQTVAYSIILHSDGHLYFGTKGAGLFVSRKKIDFANLKSEDLSFEHFHIGTDENRNGNNIYSLAETADGSVWVATYGDGVHKVKISNNKLTESVVLNTETSNILSNKARYVFIDSDSALWISTTNGVCRLKQENSRLTKNDEKIKFEHFVHDGTANSLSYSDVCYIFEDSRHSIYFATIGGGLTILTEKRDGSFNYEVYDTSNGIGNNAVYGIVEDDGGNVWLSTENGLTRMNVSAKTFELFNDNTGLLFNSFSEATIAKLSDGRLAFGGYKGFVIVSPMLFAPQPYKSELVLTGLTISNVEQNVGADNPLSESIVFANNIDLNYDQSSIAISYRALDYLAPENIRYAYMLKGMDKDWTYVGNTTKAVYTNLHPGEYTFMVKHTYRNGEWSSDVRTISIVVHSPWWKTWWAYLIYATLLVVIIYFLATGISSVNKYRRELKLERKINEIKLQFFTNIAHEIRTPLTLIVSPIETLIKSDLPQNVQNQLMIIKRNSNRILLLVNQLLDFRKVQNKRMHLRVSEVDLGTFVSQVGDGFKLLADHKRIEFNTIIQPDMQKVWLDMAEMDTVVYNLLSNAMKFTDSGKHVTLSISQDEQYSYIKVIDEGCGISNTNPDVLYKRYTILSTNELSGTGIGLSLAYELVELHEGKLLVESEVGKGTTFTVRLLNGKKHFEDNENVTFTDTPSAHRLAVLPDVPIVDEDLSEVEKNNDRHSLLIVEDNPEILDYLKQSFKGTFDCYTATNGQEALLMAKELMPSVIISDLMMPIMDGQKMIKTLKEDIATCHIPIVALTAKASVDVEIESYRMGVDAFIAKPFNIEQVKAVIFSILSRRERLAADLAGLNKGITLTSTLTVSEPENDSSKRGEDQVVNINIMSKDEEFVRDMVKFTEDNYRDDLSIDRFAEHFNMSRTVFYNKVKGLTGQSPLEFVRQIKFKIAEQLLQKGYNVSEVAFEIGYSDVKYFSKQFRQQYGVAPSQIKKEYEEKAKDEKNSEDKQPTENN